MHVGIDAAADAADRILPSVRHDARFDAAAEYGQDAEQNSEDSNQNRLAAALITMSKAENGGRENHSSGGAAAPRGKLALEIAAEDGFLTNAGGDA